jgi:hypothetical protein
MIESFFLEIAARGKKKKRKKKKKKKKKKGEAAALRLHPDRRPDRRKAYARVGNLHLRVRRHKRHAPPHGRRVPHLKLQGGHTTGQQSVNNQSSNQRTVQAGASKDTI